MRWMPSSTAPEWAGGKRLARCGCLSPPAAEAVIEPAKLHAYLLSQNHPIGGFKATFFLALGDSSENWRQLEADGQKYAIRATLVGPMGRSAEVMSVWVVPTGEQFARFVTA